MGEQLFRREFSARYIIMPLIALSLLTPKLGVYRSNTDKILYHLHSLKDYEASLEASEILFGKGTAESLAALSKEMFFAVFEGIPQYNIPPSKIKDGIGK